MMFDIDGARSLKTIHDKGKTLTFDTASRPSSSSSNTNSSSPSSDSLELMALNSDEVSTSSLKKKKMSHPLATVRNSVPASSDEVDGSAQGATLSG